MKALIRAPFSNGYLERLGRQLQVVYEPWTATGRLMGPDELAARIRDQRLDIVVVEADLLFAPVFAARRLKLAGVCRNALDLVDLAAATKRRIPVVHAVGRNNAAVAELAIGHMLTLARRVVAAHATVSARQWTSPIDAYLRFRGRELGGSTVGIIGLGQIGREVAKRARALGARVIAYDPYVPEHRGRTVGARLVPLRALLRQSDFVTCHTPPGPSAEGLLDGAALDLMKSSAYLVNTGAPNVLDYEALAERLRARRIAGAALDVFPGFVLALNSPLLELDNVLLTPHIGGATEETIERQSRMVTEDIERFLRGERPRRLANPEALSGDAH